MRPMAPFLVGGLAGLAVGVSSAWLVLRSGPPPGIRDIEYEISQCEAPLRLEALRLELQHAHEDRGRLRSELRLLADHIADLRPIDFVRQARDPAFGGA